MTTLLRQRASYVWTIALSASVFAASGQAQVENPDLNGLELRCCAILEIPYVVNVPGGFGGLGVKYLRDLERALNFKCVSLFEYEADESKYGGFTGLTRYFNDCAEDGDSSACQCDIAVSGFAMTAERLSRVDFPAPYAFDSFSVVQRLDGFKNSNGDSVPLLFAPFEVPVWGGLISILVTHAFVTLCDMEFLPEEETEEETRDLSAIQSLRYYLLKNRPLRKIRYAIIYTAYTMLGSEPPLSILRLHRRSAPTRQNILRLIAQCAGLFMILCYEAGLVVQLFTDEPVSVFRSIEDVKNCRIDAKDFCVPSGGATHDSWTFAIEAARENCRKVSVEEDQPKFVKAEGRFKDPFSAGLNAVAEGDCTYFMALSSTITVASENEYCDVLSVVGDPFFPVAISFVLPKGSNIAGPISTATLKFQLADSLPAPVEYGAPRKCNNAISANRLNWARVNILFYVTWALHGVMLAYMLFDKRGSRSEEKIEA